ncbi:TylF/MycF/NovP-related O-methyltransferase [Paraburkholderia hospita]|uniref:TylF/MycF/NovP-related O-methyltransferase n=1 Tax=Paraburkholderia hospita TaxID=169430 RepID=UPI0002718270|nr:TylF/MycF/NovP-related O-methyltransferase [Paraburkholderia hospita]SKC94042.1 Glycosyltransferase involved in cell wall bisynthesis [Paraburkholderia hospita]
MKILLLTDVPPCTNYTAGMVLGQIVKVLPKGSVSCFCVLNPDLQNIERDPELSDLPLEFVAKPREAAFPRTGLVSELKSYAAEQFRRRVATPNLVNRVADFAHRQNVDTIWAVLQGQTMVRLAAAVSDRLQMPLFTLVWDPLAWWLQANQVDRWTSRQSIAEFDAVIHRSRAVATASPAMSVAYEAKYGVRSVALIASHDRANSFAPKDRPHRDGELVLGMAGQFYANAEWQTLVKTLNQSSWSIGGRDIRLLVLGHYIPDSDIPEGKVEFLGWKSQKEAIRILAEQTDVLYCPYPFDPALAEVSRLSFPSKLVSYFAAGRPVLLHAPLDSSPAVFLKKTGAGLVTASSGASNVYNAIERLAEDPGLFKDLAAASQHVFSTEFTLERMRDRALEFFGVVESELIEAPPARVPFDPASAAAHLPPPRTQETTAVRVLRVGLAVARRTPLRPLANLGARSVHAYRRRKVVRPRALAASLDHLAAEVHLLKSQNADISRDLMKQSESVDRSLADLEQRELRMAEMLQEQIRSSMVMRELEVANASMSEQIRGANRTVRELEIANASLSEQLRGANRAYESLSETHRFLNQRFDSVASASLAKLNMLSSGTFAKSPGGAHNASLDGAKYLDLLESVLTGEAVSDPSSGPWAKPGFSADTRLLGRDWPQTALTMIGRTRLRNVRTLTEAIIKDGIPGDLIETGVWRGGACIYMRAILDLHGVTDKTVWVADSFRGLPEPDATLFAADTGDTHHTHPELAVSADQVRANFERFGLLDGQVEFLEGWFKDTLPTAPIEQIALLRLDGDMYESTWEALEALYHKVSLGGFIVVDDYILPACAKAIEDWRAQERITAPLNEIDGAAVYWQKN